MSSPGERTIRRRPGRVEASSPVPGHRDPAVGMDRLREAVLRRKVCSVREAIHKVLRTRARRQAGGVRQALRRSIRTVPVISARSAAEPSLTMRTWNSVSARSVKGTTSTVRIISSHTSTSKTVCRAQTGKYKHHVQRRERNL